MLKKQLYWKHEEWIKQKRLLDEEIKERQKELRLEEKAMETFKQFG